MLACECCKAMSDIDRMKIVVLLHTEQKKVRGTGRSIVGHPNFHGMGLFLLRDGGAVE